MKMFKLFLALLVLAITFASVGLAAEGDTEFTNVVATGDVTAGDDLVVGDDATIGGDLSSTSVVVTQYLRAQYFSKVTRPASGAPKGSVIVYGGATADCGNNGTTINVCVSNGTNWLPV
jgi:hypothetical protein